jgi:hypothetical protein
VTGCGLTWVQVATVTYNTLASADSRLTVFRAMGGSPTEGNIVADWSGVTQQCGLLSWAEADGVDTGGTNGSAAVVQAVTSASNAATSIGASLSPFGDGTNNAAWAVATHDGSVSAMTVTANGYTELGTQQTITAPNARIGSAWRVGDADPSFTWTANRDVAMIAVEIKAAATGVTGSGAVTFDGMTSSGEGSVGGGGGAAIDQGYDFRASEPYVTDADGEIWVGGGTANGWSTDDVNATDGSTGVDYRLAGSCWIENDGTQGTYSITLPSTGTFTIRIAAGAVSFASDEQFVQIQDDTTPVLTINQAAGYGIAQFYDATNTLRTSASDWVSNNASVDLTFTTTTLRILLGTAGSNPSTWSAIAHLHIFSAGGGGGGPVEGVGAVTWAGMTSSGSGIGPGGSSGKPAQGATVNAAHALAPVHCWLMDEATGRPHDIGTAALPPPSLDTPTWSTVGGFGAVTQWDGTKHTEYGTGNLLAGSTKFTIVLSAKPDATLGWNQTGAFLSKKVSAGSGFILMFGPSASGFTSSMWFEVGIGTTYGIDYGWYVPTPSGTQQQIIVAYDAARAAGDRVRLYIDGTQITDGHNGGSPVSVEGTPTVPSDTTTMIKLGEGAKWSETQDGKEFKGDLGYLYIINNFFPTAGEVASLASNPFPFARTSPLLTAISATGLTNTTATITWTTEVNATSRVEYGITDYAQSATDGALVTAHSMPLSGLTPNTVYQFRVKSTASSVTATSGHFSFQTTPTPAVLGPVLIDKLSSTKVRVSFASDIPTTAVVDYGVTVGYGSQVTDTTLQTLHRIMLSGLSAATPYHIRATVTTASLVSTLSPDRVFQTTIADIVAPAAITNLSVLANRIAQNGVRLRWTAPGSDGTTGRAATYTVKRSTAMINEGNFAAATTVAQTIDATMAGGTEEVIVPGLNPSTTYFFAVKTTDAEGNTSAVSNIPSTTTLAGRAAQDVWGGDTRIQSPTGINVGCTFSGVSTGMTSTVLTHAGASFPIDGRLVGKLICPNTAFVDAPPNNRQLWYRIASNTATTITIVGGPDGALTDHATSGNAYMITGVFRVEKIGDQWWFIDPEGYAYCHRGAVGVVDKFGGGFETTNVYTAIYLETAAGTKTANLRLEGASWAMDPAAAPGDVIDSSGVTCQAVNDKMYIGHSRPFAETYFQMSQVGVGGAIQWYYSISGGSGWQLLGVGGATGHPYNTLAFSGNANYTDQSWAFHISDTGTIQGNGQGYNGLRVSWFRPEQYPAPTDWAPVTLSGTDGVARYYLRGVVTTQFTTDPKVNACFDCTRQSQLIDLKYQGASVSIGQGLWDQMRGWGLTGCGYSSSYADYAMAAGLVRHAPIWHHTNVTYNAEPIVKNMYSQVPNSGSPDIGRSIYGVSTGLTATTLTDSTAPFGAVNSLVGKRMVPNTAADNSTFSYSYPIVSNTSTVVTISGGDTASMLDHATVGDQWKIAMEIGREQVDVWEPSLYDSAGDILNYPPSSPYVWWHFRPNPNVLFYVTDEPDFIYGMSWEYERTHMIYCVAASNPYRVENLKHGPVGGGDHRLFAKYAWRDYLRYKYKPAAESKTPLTRESTVPLYTYTGSADDNTALTNLNAAWNTAYTTWDTQSGSIAAGTNAWKWDNTTGTGFMDENGIHLVTTFPPLANGSVGAHVSYDNLEANCRTQAIYNDIRDFSALTASKYTYIVYDQLHARSPNLVASFFYGPSPEQARAINEYADIEWTSTSPLLTRAENAAANNTALPGHVVYRYLNDHERPLYYEVYTMCTQDSPINYGGVVSSVSYSSGTNRTEITWTLGQPLLIRNSVDKFIHVVESDTAHRIVDFVGTTLYVAGDQTAFVAVGNTIEVPDAIALAWGYPDWPKTHASAAAAERDELSSLVMTARAPDGTYPVAGISKWGFQDNPQMLGYETSAWGWNTSQFNAYDGIENVVPATKDANGVWRGGEYKAYGDYVTTMRAFMLSLEDTLVLRTTVPLAPTFVSTTAVTWDANELETFSVATAGSPPAAITLDAGSLPAGTALLSNGDGSAVLGGVPTVTGTFPITLRATNSAGTVTQAFTIHLGAAPPSPTLVTRKLLLGVGA